MNCKGMTRVDMFVTPEDTIILNEVNTIPGFTDTIPLSDYDEGGRYSVSGTD